MKGWMTLKKLKERMQASGKEYEIHLTDRKGQAAEYAARLSEKEGATIVAVGGDGTVNEVLSGIADLSRCTFGILPCGTGNDFAASVDLPEGLDSLDIILRGETKYTDYLQFEDGKRSLNIAGVGIDVDILDRCERGRWHGKGKYFLSLLKSVFTFRGIRLAVEANGERKEYNAMIAACCNGKQFGGGIRICPSAVVDDGKMDLVVVDFPQKSKIPGALLKLMKGKIFDLPFAHHILCEKAVIETEDNIIAQFDGELKQVSGMSVSLVSGKLKMLRG